MTQALNTPLQPGDLAPEFALPTVQGDRLASLADYRGKSSLLLALFPGLYCPFCRRSIVQLASTSERLKAQGIETIAVVATDLENARLYCSYRPAKVTMVVDPDRTTHRSYGVPELELTPEVLEAISAVRVNPNGELPRPMTFDEAAPALNALDGFQATASDLRDAERQGMQLKGQFLIDRDGRIRWANLEGTQGPASMGKFPTYEELAAAVQLHAVT
jgi:peroxiredoxin